MEQVIDKEITLSKLSVQLGSFRWETTEEFSPSRTGYYICQRLSDGHSAIKVDNVATGEAFRRVRSVGFLPPAWPIRLYPVERPFRALSCIFDKTFFEDTTEIQPGQWNAHSDAFVNIQSKRLEMMMQQIHAEMVEPGFGADLLIEAASTMILVEMARHGRKSLGRTDAESGSGQGLAPWQMRRIRERMQASLDVGYPSLGELARLCGISQSHLMRTFKASTGWQIHKYIVEERLNAAKLMLAEDQLSSKEISARLGFCSPAYFATAFRRMTGVTPTDFRRRAMLREAGNA